VLGGWMLSRLWWGWVFLLNVPIVAVGLIAALVLIPESRAAQRPALDPLGTITSAAGLVAATYGLIQAGQDGWGDPGTLALMAVGVAALAGFAVRERRLGRRGGTPLVDPELFRSASFTWGAVLGGMAGLAMIGVLFVMPQYFQAVQGASALSSGLRLLPLVGGLIAGALPASALARAAGAKLTATLGFILLAAGALVGATTGTAASTAFIAVWMAVLGAGTGLTLTAATAAALSRLSPERSGTGSAVVQAFQKTAGFTGGMDVSLAASAGIAITGALLTLAFLPRRTTVTDVTDSSTGTGAARPGLRERKKARTRATIQACALRLFREQGYDATTIEQIIEAADVSETTFFRYFPAKEDVVLADDYDPLLVQAFQAQPGRAPPLPRGR
jgi:MFS transporter, DHA2 family, multidrug resistance protein